MPRIATIPIEGGTSTTVYSSNLLRCNRAAAFLWAPDERLIFAQDEPWPMRSENLWAIEANPTTGIACSNAEKLTNLLRSFQDSGSQITFRN